MNDYSGLIVTEIYGWIEQDIFVAETDTTASTLEWAMTELVRNPHVMSKAKQELEQMTSKGNPIEEADIAKLPYLQAICLPLSIRSY